MKIVKSTGLVPVKALGSFDNYLKDAVFGLTPESALNLEAKGFVEILDTAGDEEMVEISVAEAPTAPAADEHDRGAIEIPDGWAEQHHTKIIALARTIIGPAAPKTVSKADAVTEIENEIARREAVAKAQENSNEPQT